VGKRDSVDGPVGALAVLAVAGDVQPAAGDEQDYDALPHLVCDFSDPNPANWTCEGHGTDCLLGCYTGDCRYLPPVLPN
jgi:hypothetical protein